jgi:hypothetical protein
MLTTRSPGRQPLWVKGGLADQETSMSGVTPIPDSTHPVTCHRYDTSTPLLDLPKAIEKGVARPSALGPDPLRRGRDRRQSRGPVICVAAVESHSGAVPADDQSVPVMFDLVNPIGTGRRSRSHNWPGRGDEPGRKVRGNGRPVRAHHAGLRRHAPPLDGRQAAVEPASARRSGQSGKSHRRHAT